MRRIVPLWLVLWAGVLAAAELPVREVILYKNGVGYFLRGGELRSGESARLDFKASEMNDVLKSLTIEDKQGKVISLRYDSSDTLAQKLAAFPFQPEGQQSLAAFLDHLKGARLELNFGSQTVAGAIVSARLSQSPDKKVEQQTVLLMVDSGELRSFDLGAVTSLRLTDGGLQAQLKDYLLAINQSRSNDKRSVYIDSSDSAARQVAASYLIPTPVWKSSYRLIFGDKATTLEGWAIVDNTTGEDWTNVRLALVSGRPVSFISQLYQPRYVQRPAAELAENRPVGPTVYEGGVVGGVVAQAAPMAAPAPKAMAMESLSKAKDLRSATGGMRAQVRDEETAYVRNEVASNLAAIAQGQDLGELFEYSFGSPITIHKNESAMMPFLQQALTTRKLLIYTDGIGQNPMNAAEISNSTGKTLDGGPITVFDQNTYAGEALMETLKAGDKRLISYAVDLGTRVTTAFESGSEMVREVHFRRGVLTTRVALQETRTYTIRNVDQKAKTLIIEQPQRPDYKLINQKPAETTAHANRFEVKLAAGATEKFPVIEERVYETSTSVTSMTPDVLGSYVQNKALSDTARRQLQQIVAKKQEIAENDNSTRQLQSDINELVNDQNRLRQNIMSLNQVSGQQDQVQKYARQLADQESKLAQMRDSVGNLHKKKTALESELNSLIEKIEF